MIIRVIAVCFAVVGIGLALDGTAGATPEPRTEGKALTMDLVMQAVDRSLAAQRGGYAHPIALRTARRSNDKTLSPYFHVPKARPGTEALPLTATMVEVQLASVIARVRVRQVYQNTGRRPIEAIYVFPGSTRAAVHGMRMKIGERVVEAQIQKRTVARRIYERARRRGQRASLLEQHRANVFTMSVANIMPGDTIVTELDYSELLVPVDGNYSFVYPAVVGPRYGGGAHPKADRWITNPYLQKGIKTPYRFGLKVQLESPIGLKYVRSPSHKISVRYGSRRRAEIALLGRARGNRDFVLNYRLAGGKIEAGVMTYRANNERFFLLMMEPPKRVERAHVPRREYIFVLDVSGSMHGFPLRTAKHLITSLLRSLRPTDYFNVVLFAESSHQLSQSSLPAKRQIIERAIRDIDKQRGGGGTKLLAALKRAYGIPKPVSQGLSRTVVVITDGYVAVEAETFRYIRKRLGQANCFAYGVGSSVNRALIEGIARAGMGSSFVATSSEQAQLQAAEFKRYIESPVLTDIKLDFRGAMVYDVVPRQPPDLLASRPLIVFGKYRSARAGSIRVTGRTGAGQFVRTLALQSNPGTRTQPLRALWARKWVESLMDQLAMLPRNQDLADAVTNLGLTYSLLTRFTSFVAVDKIRVNRTGKTTTVRQPLPLPHGVSEQTVGGARARRLSVVARPPPVQAGGPEPRADEAAGRSPQRAQAAPCARRAPIGGCQCQTDGAAGFPALLLMLGIWLLGRRRRT